MGGGWVNPPANGKGVDAILYVGRYDNLPILRIFVANEKNFISPTLNGLPHLPGHATNTVFSGIRQPFTR